MDIGCAGCPFQERIPGTHSTHTLALLDVDRWKTGVVNGLTCRKKKKRLREGSNAEKSGQDEDEDQERKQTSTVVAGFVEERRWAASTERSPRYSYLLLYQVYIKQLYSNRSCIRTYWY